MISVRVEITEGATLGHTRREVRVNAPTIERAVELAAGPEGNGRTARVLFPIDEERFFVPGFDPVEAPSTPSEVGEDPVEEAFEVHAGVAATCLA